METHYSLRLFAWLSVLILLLAGQPAAAEPYTLTTENYPPYNMEDHDGNITGVSTDIVTELFRRAELEFEIELLPWQRAYHSALVKSQHGVFSTSRTSERETLFKWVGPLIRNHWVLLAKPEIAKQLNSLEDARNFRIGGYRGDATAIFLANRGFELDLASRDNVNALKLDSGRIDLWATGHLLGPYYANEQGVSGLVEVLTFHSVDMALAMNKDTPDELIERLNSILRQMREDGTIDSIQASYQ